MKAAMRSKEKEATACPFKKTVSYLHFRYPWIMGGAGFLFLVAVGLYWNGRGTVGSAPQHALEKERLLLSEGRLEAWAFDAEHLARQRDKGVIQIPARTVPELIEWGRQIGAALGKQLKYSDPLTFLELTSAIENARNNFRALEDYEVLLEQVDRLTREGTVLADRVYTPRAPKLNEWEEVDLDVYLIQSALVETALSELLPSLPPLVSNWACEESREPLEEGAVNGEKTGDEVRRMSWRVISRSRYGPRVLRKSTSLKEYRFPETARVDIDEW